MSILKENATWYPFPGHRGKQIELEKMSGNRAEMDLMVADTTQARKRFNITQHLAGITAFTLDGRLWILNLMLEDHQETCIVSLIGEFQGINCDKIMRPW